MCCEWNYPAGVTNCKVVCTGTAGFGHVLVLVLGWGSLPLWGSGGGAGLERHDSVFVEIIGRYYWHVGAKDANYPIMLSILCYIMIILCFCWEKSFFVHLTGRVLLSGAVPGGDRFDLAMEFSGDRRNALLGNMDIFCGHVFPLVLSLLFGNWLKYSGDWKEISSYNKCIGILYLKWVCFGHYPIFWSVGDEIKLSFWTLQL